jgi:dTMP kinase
VDTLNRGCPEIRKPDLCIFLDLAPEKSMERITKNRSAEELEIYETLDRLSKVREKFLSVFDRLAQETDPEKKENVVIIDASGTIEEVAAKIRAAVLG